MTATDTLHAVPLPVLDEESKPVTYRRVVASEWIKWKSLRSTWATLGGAVAGMVVIGLLVAYNTRHLTPNIQPNDADPSGPLQGYYLGQLLIGALGVLFVSGEYSTGMVRSTLTAVPKRLPALWAKLTVLIAVVAAAMIPATVVAFLAAQGLISGYRPGFSLGDPGVLRVVIGTGVYMVAMGVIGSALGWIVRSTPGALVAYVGLLLILPVLFGQALGSWGRDVAQYFPSRAGTGFAESIRESYTLTPWAGALVLLAWVVVSVAVAARVLRSRDA